MTQVQTTKDIYVRLSDPANVPESVYKHRPQGGIEITYIPWHELRNIADDLVPGWEGSIVSQGSVTGDIQPNEKRKTAGRVATSVYVVYRISVPTPDGNYINREAIGFSSFDDDGYGDPFSNAQSMAFRRAWAMHGLGIWLYSDEYKSQSYGGGNGGSSGENKKFDGVLAFGKHKGEHISQVPDSWLEWAIEKDIIKFDDQKQAIVEEIAKRKGGGAAPAKLPPSAPGASTSTGDKVTAQDLAALRNSLAAVDRQWDEVTSLVKDSFNKARASDLTKDEYALLKIELGISA